MRNQWNGGRVRQQSETKFESGNKTMKMNPPKSIIFLSHKILLPHKMPYVFVRIQPQKKLSRTPCAMPPPTWMVTRWRLSKIATGFFELHPRATAGQFHRMEMQQALQSKILFELIVPYLERSARFENHHVRIHQNRTFG